MNRFLKVLLVISLTMNGLLIFFHYYDKPDLDFYSGSRKTAYLIKAQEPGDYMIIEHLDSDDGRVHRYKAKCGDTLTWLKGIVNSGEPMSNGCIYLPREVGKRIAAGKMRKEGNTIVYVPWSNEDTVQTADVLTIVDDQIVK